MVMTLRESKAKLSELVELASTGEDVLISVRGVIRARLTAAATPSPESMGESWAARLRTLQLGLAVPQVPGMTSDEILAELRADRD